MRLFAAIPLPGPVRDRLADLAQPIEGVRWQRQHQLHITLKFLGETRKEHLNAVINGLRTVRQQASCYRFDRRTGGGYGLTLAQPKFQVTPRPISGSG